MIYEHISGGSRINLISANEYVPYIEYQIKLVNKRTRSISNSLPFKNIPNVLAISILFAVFRMLNYLQVKEGLSVILSPKTITSGETLHYKRHLGINIGQYFQVNEHEDPRNSQVPCTKGAIYLNPVKMNKGGSDL